MLSPVQSAFSCCSPDQLLQGSRAGYPSSVSGPYHQTLAMVADASEATFAKVDFVFMYPFTPPFITKHILHSLVLCRCD
jgi:hypothetical protein